MYSPSPKYCACWNNFVDKKTSYVKENWQSYTAPGKYNDTLLKRQWPDSVFRFDKIVYWELKKSYCHQQHSSFLCFLHFFWAPGYLQPNAEITTIAFVVKIMPPQTLVSILHYRTIPPAIKQTREKKILPKYTFFPNPSVTLCIRQIWQWQFNPERVQAKWRSRKVKRDYCVHCHQFKFARKLIKLCNALEWVICYSQLVIIHVKTSQVSMGK